MNQKPYSSPVLMSLEEDARPSDDTACASCPISLWHITNLGQIACFCAALHRLTWIDQPKQYITRCDAREQALAERYLKDPDPVQAVAAGRRG